MNKKEILISFAKVYNDYLAELDVYDSASLWSSSRAKKCLDDLDQLINSTMEDYEPYFGWCDVKGCNDEGCSGGNAWRETGYWTVCSNHADDYRKGKPQPKMKQLAIDREKSRDKTTGYLFKE